MSATVKLPDGFKSDELRATEALMLERAAEYGNLATPDQAPLADPADRPVAQHIGEPSPERRLQLLAEVDEAERRRAIPPTPAEPDEAAAREALRAAVEVLTVARDHLAGAETVLRASAGHVETADSTLRTFSDLDDRISDAIISELRQSGRADLPSSLASELRERGAVIDKIDSLRKVHAQLSREANTARAAVKQAEIATHAAAQAVLAAHAERLAVQVQDAETHARTLRSGLAGISRVADVAGRIVEKLTPFTHHILRQGDAPAPLADQAHIGWQAVRDRLVEDPDTVLEE